jgi:hypothetical protein
MASAAGLVHAAAARRLLHDLKEVGGPDRQGCFVDVAIECSLEPIDQRKYRVETHEWWTVALAC